MKLKRNENLKKLKMSPESDSTLLLLQYFIILTLCYIISYIWF